MQAACDFLRGHIPVILHADNLPVALWQHAYGMFEQQTQLLLRDAIHLLRQLLDLIPHQNTLPFFLAFLIIPDMVCRNRAEPCRDRAFAVVIGIKIFVCQQKHIRRQLLRDRPVMNPAKHIVQDTLVVTPINLFEIGIFRHPFPPHRFIISSIYNVFTSYMQLFFVISNIRHNYVAQYYLSDYRHIRYD